MRRAERADEINEAILAALRGHQATVWTALPGIVLSFNPAAMTCEIQPAMQALVTSSELVGKWVTLPPLVDCPVVFPGGGGFTLTFPVKPGDECLVVFASRCIDSWWQQGGSPQPAEIRFNDLSDGFVIVGPRSQPRVLSGLSTSDVVLRSDSGVSKVSIKANNDISLTTSANVTISAAQVNITGEVNITGNLNVTGNTTTTGNTSTTGTLNAGGKNVGSSHTHSGVSTGGGTTGVPT